MSFLRSHYGSLTEMSPIILEIKILGYQLVAFAVLEGIRSVALLEDMMIFESLKTQTTLNSPSLLCT